MSYSEMTAQEILDFLIAPGSMVVVGVSSSSRNLAKEILRNCLAFGYKGRLFAVGPKGGEIWGQKIYRSIGELPGKPEFAAILVPAAHVPAVLDECGQAGIRGALISSGGFSEYEDKRAELEAEILAIARRHRMRFLGPNCIGVVNLDLGLCMPFAPIRSLGPRRGNISVISQSGGVGLKCMDMLTEEHVGFSKMISMGNKLDIDEADCIEALAIDPETRVICLYLEGISKGRRFIEAAVKCPKPIIALKANRSPVSNTIARSHTAALASDDRVVDAAFKQAAVIRVRDLAEFVPCAKALELPPLRGNRLVVISMSGGLSVIGADACAEFGFELPPIPPSLTAALEERRRGGVIHLSNPLDFGDIYDPSAFAFAVEELLKLEEFDGAVVSLPRLDGFADGETQESRSLGQLATYFKNIMARTAKPLAISFFSGRRAIEPLLASREVPVFIDIRESIWALAVQRDYWERRGEQGTEVLSISTPGTSSPPRRGKLRYLPTDKALELVQAAGIRIAEARLVTTLGEVEAAAAELGFPLAMKAAVTGIVHKTDLGALSLNLESLDQVKRAFGDLKSVCQGRALEPRILVQRMVKSGIELIVGGRRDDTFGPIVLFGLGGVWVEVLEDIVVRLAPISEAEAKRMIEEIKGRKLLHGHRGKSAVDDESLCKSMSAVSRIIASRPDIAEVEVNPLIASAGGAVAVDARVGLVS